MTSPSKAASSESFAVFKNFLIMSLTQPRRGRENTEPQITQIFQLE